MSYIFPHPQVKQDRHAHLRHRMGMLELSGQPCKFQAVYDRRLGFYDIVLKDGLGREHLPIIPHFSMNQKKAEQMLAELARHYQAEAIHAPPDAEDFCDC